MPTNWTITKDFAFCYGHRVWTQKLNPDLVGSAGTGCQCRHLHGHQALVRVSLGGDRLHEGMVTDFKHLGWLKDFLDCWVDHKFIIDLSDPLFPDLVLRPAGSVGPLQESTASFLESKCSPVWGSAEQATGTPPAWIPTIPATSAPAVCELLSGLLIVDFTPTSENLSKWLFDIVAARMDSLTYGVTKVEWYETPKSCATYSGPATPLGLKHA